MDSKKPKGPFGAVMKEQTKFPSDIKITRCPPSRRGVPRGSNARPRKGGRIISWAVAEALAPDSGLSYDEQVANQSVKVERVIPALKEHSDD